MKKISMSFIHTPGVTCLPNTFIDVDMLQSNELQLKVYLYLLRNMSTCDIVDISAMADHFNQTEHDIERAIHFWERRGTFSTTALEEESTNKPLPQTIKQNMSRDDKTNCLEQDTFRELLFLAETYLGKPLSTSDITSLQFIKEHLKFSDELLAYLLEYCAERKKKSFHYIETVARAWADEQITTVAAAKANSSRYSSRIYSVLNALGVKEEPLSIHLEYIEKWYETYAFDLDIILEACRRTVLATTKNRFAYADTILTNWHNLGVHHVSDIAQKDQAYKKSLSTNGQSDKPSTPSTPGYVAANPFLKYKQRNTDYDALKQQLM